MIPEFLTVTLIGLLVIISPGPDFAIVTKTSLSDGRVAGWASALGISIANLCHVALNLLGIGVIIAQSAVAFTILKILGATYLLYIGFKGLRAKPLPPTTESISTLDKTQDLSVRSCQALAKKGFQSGLLTSILNPKACLFFLSFFSVILSSDTPFFRQVFYGVWISFLALVWFTLVAFFFTNPIIGAKLKKGKHWIERFTGGALMFLGIRLLGTKVTL